LIADKHLRNVVNKALETYKQTNGVFDITIYPLTEAWGFGVKKVKSIPTATQVRSLMTCINSNLLAWSGKKLIKKKACVRLDPNGIAQGYTVDVIAQFLEDNGIKNYLVELGGEIRVKGRKYPENEAMKVGIELPGDDQYENSILQHVIQIDSGAITTSGSYRKFYESKGKKISHILDARTGLPAQNELISVTVIAKEAMTADAYDNALMAMGLSKALEFVEKRKDISAHFIYKAKNGAIKDTASVEFYRFLQQ
jgi:FAD:protein FMN transferase